MLTGQNQQFLGGGAPTGGAMLCLFKQNIPCTHSEILTNFFLDAGKNSTTAIAQCEFLVADVPVESQPKIAKGVFCDLTPVPGGAVYHMQLWVGGLLPGGAVYRFMLVDKNYKI